jgi:hypothetical protein
MDGKDDMRRLILFHLMTSILLITSVIPVSAHRPDWGDQNGATRIEDIQVSFAFYRELKTTDQVDVYEFDARAGEHLHAGINIPDLPELQDFGVSVAMFGPGLPAANESTHGSLPADHPEDLGMLVFESQKSENFFESFTQTNYLGRQQIEVDLPEDGTYYLLVWHPSGERGKYVLDVGRREVFGMGDLFLFPVWWIQARIYFGQGPQIIAVAFMVIMGAALALFTVILRRRWRIVR